MDINHKHVLLLIQMSFSTTKLLPVLLWPDGGEPDPVLDASLQLVAERLLLDQQLLLRRAGGTDERC